VSATTWPLFAIPVLVILLVAGVLLRRLGKRRSDAGEMA
jgi:cytochrome c-type biogenesis protein CcmH